MPKVALVQLPSPFLDRDAAFDVAERAISTARGEGAELIVFPETFIGGYPDWIWRLRPWGDFALTGAIHERLVAKWKELKEYLTGDVLHFGVVTATVVWPAFATHHNAPSGNNDSIVLRLQYGARTILMTGDLEKEGESTILGANANLRSDVVKVPHHGSRTSSTEPFVLAARPSVAIISVGQTSVFGHPHKEVVERWHVSGAEVLTTGRCGTITVTTDGRELKVERFVPPQE